MTRLSVLPADALVLWQAELPVLADEILAAIAQEVPSYARPFEGDFGRGVNLGVQVALGRFLDPQVALDRDVYVGLGRGEARVGRSLEALLSAYRVGARLAWARLANVGLRSGLSPEELVALAAAVFAYIDELSAASAEGYAAEQSQLTGDRDRRRAVLARLLLAESSPRDLAEAAEAAGWLPPTTLTAVVVPLGAGHELATRWDDRALVVTEDDGPRGSALLLLPDVDGPGGSARLARLLAGRTAVVGLPVAWTAARTSVALARRAARLRDGGVVHVADLLAELVVSADPVALEALAVRRLRPLAGLTATQRERMESTLRAWLAHQGDRQRIAAALGVHPQTVRYRVGLLRDLLGADLDDPLRRLELELVLLRRALG
ncbi:MAG: helix-turn-helix domain-containing protein [Mycobacteriales bacterium]|nr:helix-turn-helix domain-containing protein [Mycobacteriales bacterium]